MRHIQTEIIIDAPARIVWSLLTDFGNYAAWNPFIIESEGTAVVDTQLRNVMKNGDSTVTFKPKVTEVRPGEYFDWLGSLGVKGLFDGRHYFQLEALGPKQTKLIHGEKFTGLLVGMILKKIGDQTRENFVAMNQALKQEAEKAATSRATA